MKQIRQTVALLLALLLLAVPVRGAEISYKDVKTDHWAYASIRRAGELKLIGGVGGGYFGVGRVLTRAEYAMMLCRLMDWTMLTPAEGSFTDNRDKTTWYYSAVETAYANGVLRKVDGKAGVEETITREEMAAMTVRALGYASLAGIVQEDCPFKDVSTNRGYITLAYHMGFMDGVWTNRFAPALAATREQAAVVLLRVYDALHATVREVHVSAAPAGAVSVAPLDERDGRVPLCPRAPLEGVYDAAVQAGRGGAVALQTAAYNATTDRTLKDSELRVLLASGARVFRSTRYESSYVSRSGSVIWFESEQDVAEKVQLCRLLGVKTVYLIP